MPFWRARLSAKRFIAGVGGRTPASPPITPPSKDGPPAPAPSVSLPIMRWATSHTASIAPTISCLPIKTSSSEHSSCAVTPGSTSAGSACSRTPNSDSPVSVGRMFFPWAIRKPCLFSPPMISARVAGVPMPLASFKRSRRSSSSTKRQAFCMASIRVPLVIAWRRARLLVLDGRVFQPCDLTVAEGWQQLRVVSLFVGGLPVWECRAPPEIGGLATRRAEREAADVKCCGRLAVAEIGHDGRQIRTRNDVEQLLLIDRKARPDLAQVVDRVDVGNDSVVARPFQPLVVEGAARTLADDWRVWHRNCAE